MRHAKQLLASLAIALPMFAFAGSASAQATADTMPEGKGKDVTVATCTKCHSITNVTAQHKDLDGWTATITKMVGYGAVGTDDDFQAILDYLVKNYGPETTPPAKTSDARSKIVINKETPAQLAADLGLTRGEAVYVVAYRTKHGSFRSMDDLKKLASVDARKFEARKRDLLFS